MNYLRVHRLMKEDSVHRSKLDHLLIVVLMTCADAIPSRMGSLLYGSRPRTYGILNFLCHSKDRKNAPLEETKMKSGGVNG